MIRGILIDYGGTIDTDGKHWAEVLWAAYCDIGIPVEKSAFLEAYKYGERYLALHPVINPGDDFFDVLVAKTSTQLFFLVENEYLPDNFDFPEYIERITTMCYEQVQKNMKKSATVLEKLSQTYPLVLVSNFYGNIRTVLKEFDIAQYFSDVIESAEVGVRKPDPAIFALGVQSLGFDADQILAVGDSYSKDIIPAWKAGCQTVWLRGKDWEETQNTGKAGLIIEHFEELLTHLTKPV